SPREGAVCRPMKVGKEEVIGCLTALETWLSLDENKLCRMEWARGSHPEAGGNCAWRENRHIHSPGWQSLSNAAGLLGSGGLAIQCVRLRAGIAWRRSSDRGARGGQSESGDRGSRR